MKKFITYVPLQPKERMTPVLYAAEGNARLDAGFPVHFPVTAMVNGYAEAGDAIELIAMVEEDNGDAEYNFDLMRRELQELAEKKGFTCSVTRLAVSRRETIEEQLSTFSRLSALLGDDDIVHACITFGTKTVPLIEFMALDFAYKTRKNFTIACLAYGKVNWVGGRMTDMRIYDVTALFSMHTLCGELAAAKVSDPSAMIARILRLA